jgi:predicted ribosome quality control (RQC) complex YloA/Tae2 family protein
MTDPASSFPGVRLIEYTLPGGWMVLVGRTAQDNDELSLRIASPNDHWFHVRGMAGSHVVLRSREGEEEPDQATLKAAAAIAAYHSKARNATRASVSYTRARFVTKPRGAKAGTVEIRNEKVFTVKPALPST